jgi:hypothetical protein
VTEQYHYHTTRHSNIVGNSTFIDIPEINGNPGAVLIVTLANVPDVNDAYFPSPHPIGVWYHNQRKQWAIFNQDQAAMRPSLSFHVALERGIVHEASSENTVGNSTYIDLPGINGDPDALLLITPNWNPNGRTDGIYNNHNVGVWYDESRGCWAIFNQDQSRIPLGAAFNVAIETCRVLRATERNTSGNYLYLDLPGAIRDGDDRAALFITQNWVPGTGSGVYNDHPVGVVHRQFENRWVILNQDGADMPLGATFNVKAIYVSALKGSTFVHRVTAQPSASTTILNTALVPDRPSEVLIVTSNWNPSRSTGVYNDHPHAVSYNGFNNHWTILNQDSILNEVRAHITMGSAFNVAVYTPNVEFAFVHRATDSNTRGRHYTILDNSLINDNPEALVFVTANLNPDGTYASTVYNPHPIGVWYESAMGRWAIFNQDLAPMPLGAGFHVVVENGYVHRANELNTTENSTYLDLPSANDQSDALLFITPNWNPRARTSGIYNNHNVGVWYDFSRRRWAIFNQDRAAMPKHAAFNVAVQPQVIG